MNRKRAFSSISYEQPEEEAAGGGWLSYSSKRAYAGSTETGDGRSGKSQKNVHSSDPESAFSTMQEWATAATLMATEASEEVEKRRVSRLAVAEKESNSGKWAVPLRLAKGWTIRLNQGGDVDVQVFAKHTLVETEATENSDNIGFASGQINRASGINDLNTGFNWRTSNMQGFSEQDKMTVGLSPFFGPIGGVQDQNPFNPMHREDWAMPEAWRKNKYLEDIQINMLVQSHQVLLTRILPLVYEENFSATQYEKIMFDRGLATAVPYEAIGRTMRSTRSAMTFQSKRLGLFYKNEYGFLQTARGRLMHWLQLKQQALAIDDTLALLAIVAIIKATQSYDLPNRQSLSGVGCFEDSDFRNYLMRRIFPDFAAVQRTKDGLDVVVESMRERGRLRGLDLKAAAKNLFVLLPPGSRMYVARSSTHRDFLLTGTARETFDRVEDIKVRETNSENVIELEPFPCGAGNEWINPLDGMSEIGEYSILYGGTLDMTSYKNTHSDITMMNFTDSGRFKTMSYLELFKGSMLLSDGTVDVSSFEMTVPAVASRTGTASSATGRRQGSAVEQKEYTTGWPGVGRGGGGAVTSVDAQAYTARFLKQRHQKFHPALWAGEISASQDASKFLAFYVQELRSLAEKKEDRTKGGVTVAQFYQMCETHFGANSSSYVDKFLNLLRSKHPDAGNRKAFWLGILASYYGITGDAYAALVNAADSGLDADTYGKWALETIYLDSRWFAMCLKNDLPTFIPLMAARSHITFKTGKVYMVIGGKGTGVVKVGYFRCMVGQIPSAQIYVASTTLNSAVELYRNENIICQPVAFVKEYKRGGTLSVAMPDKETRDAICKGDWVKDVFALALYPGEPQSDGWSSVQDLVGYFNPTYVRKPESKYSTSEFYAAYWNFHHTKGQNFITDPTIGGDKPHDNTIIPLGKSYGYDTKDGKFTVETHGTGWTANWARDGVMRKLAEPGAYLELEQSSVIISTQG